MMEREAIKWNNAEKLVMLAKIKTYAEKKENILDKILYL